MMWRPRHPVAGHNGGVMTATTANDHQILNFNNISTTQSFLEQEPAVEHRPPTAIYHDEQWQQTFNQVADTPLLEVFSSMLSEYVQQQFDLSNHFTEQLAGHGSQTSLEHHGYLNRLADRIHARVNDVINSRRIQISQARTHGSQIHVDGQDTHSPFTFSPESLWTGQTSTQPEHFAPRESYHAVPTQSNTDFVESWQQDDVLVHRTTQSEPSNRSWVFSNDQVEGYPEYGIASGDGSHSAISA
jgi:hypothetical protein